VPTRSADVNDEKQYEALEDEGMSKQRAARIAQKKGRPQGRQVQQLKQAAHITIPEAHA